MTAIPVAKAAPPACNHFVYRGIRPDCRAGPVSGLHYQCKSCKLGRDPEDARP